MHLGVALKQPSTHGCQLAGVGVNNFVLARGRSTLFCAVSGSKSSSKVYRWCPGSDLGEALVVCTPSSLRWTTLVAECLVPGQQKQLRYTVQALWNFEAYAGRCIQYVQKLYWLKLTLFQQAVES